MSELKYDEALELLEEVTMELTEIGLNQELGPLRDRLLDLSDQIDDFLVEGGSDLYDGDDCYCKECEGFDDDDIEGEPV